MMVALTESEAAYVKATYLQGLRFALDMYAGTMCNPHGLTSKDFDRDFVVELGRYPVFFPTYGLFPVATPSAERQIVARIIHTPTGRYFESGVYLWPMGDYRCIVAEVTQLAE